MFFDSAIIAANHYRKAYLPIIKNPRNTNSFRHTVTKLLFLCLLTLVYLVCSKHAPDYEFHLDFFQTPFLVERVYNGSIEVNLRLDVVDEGTSAIRKSDYVIFNTGHWFTDPKTYGGQNYYQEGNYVHPQQDHMEAYTRALKTWAKWIDHTFSHGKTKVFFQALSPTHFRGGQWNSGGKCHTETEPIFNETFLEEYPVHNRIFEQVREGMQTPVVYLNITRLTDYRKDGHTNGSGLLLRNAPNYGT
ncbi:hypothetical protein QJS10_CPB12g00154 [Acorus calamus]|uniref:Trichome birefringence-like C-terminal domain-containing protein n=1 Tax=Acorus calamus TaxID=4465 RepID=A0AAV9DMS4_ACOCL|nr:hypothetical protein QJS10_CPB12g00154 [Acorus calamus]